jgi:hypothetical protein
MCVATLTCMNLKRGLSLSNQDTRRPRAQVQFNVICTWQLVTSTCTRQKDEQIQESYRSTEGHSSDNMNELDHYEPRLSES